MKRQPRTPEGKTYVGIDISDGVETHCEGFMRDGVFYVTDMYEIIDGKAEVLDFTQLRRAK